MKYYLCALLLAVAGWSGAAETTYPVRPVRVLVPHAPGGPTDVMARVAGQRLSEC